MSEQRNLLIVRPCLTLSLAIALAAIGLVIFFDYLSSEGSVNARIALAPGGGLVSLLVSVSLLALLFRRSKAATALAAATITVAIGQAALPYMPVTDALTKFAISLPLLLVILLTAITLIAAIQLSNGRLVGRVTGPFVMAIGLLSLLSYWFPPLQAFSLGTMPESTIIVSPLAILIGLDLLFLHRIHNQEIPDFSPALVLVGVLGITLTTTIWHNMRIQNSNNLQATAEVLTGLSDEIRWIDSHHDTRRGTLADSALYLPPLVLFTGLILSFLVMLSHLFWRESERRSGSLQTLNKSMSAHLVREQSLRHTNERIMEFSRDILCSINAQGIFLAINPASEGILGYRPDELIGERYDALIAPEDREATAEELRKLVAGERQLSDGFRIHLRHREGHIVTLSWTAEWSEKDQALFCVARDMTDQLVAETLRREREQFFSLSPDMFCIVDLNSHFFELNQAFEDVLGYPREELIGASYRQLVHEEDRSRIEDAITAMIAGNNITALPVRAIAKDNTEHWLELSATLSSDELIYVAARDTTEVRRTQAQLQRFADRQSTIFESITDAFFTLDCEWRFTYVNQRSEELLRQSRDQLLGHTIWEMFPDAVGTEFEDQYRYAVETRESVCFEAYYEPLDNWLELSIYPSEEGLAVYYRSIKERRLAQQKLEQTMAELERSNRELQDFAFVASHDLQEPLRKIQAFSDRLLTRSDRFNEQEQDYLQRMQSAAGRMQSLIQDLLTYSRVTTRAKPLTVCDTNRILGEVLQDMETAIARENAVIDISPLPTITGDATQIRQVLQNLLSNAIKFHKPDQNPQVLIRAENSAYTGWTLAVSDNGVGFDERYAEKLFHPFQRLHQQAFAGTGIGMAIVKKILDRHGATVTVESVIDQGTTFRIHFPTNHRNRTNSNA